MGMGIDQDRGTFFGEWPNGEIQTRWRWWCGERILEEQKFGEKRKGMLETGVVNIWYTFQCALIFPRRHEKMVMRKGKMDISSQALAFFISEKGPASTNRPPTKI